MGGLMENGPMFWVPVSWALSLFFAASLGWLLGRVQVPLVQFLQQVLAQFSGQYWSRPMKAQKTRAVVPMALSLRREIVTVDAPLEKRGTHPFRDMPPVETVRAEARALRDEENIWDTPGIAAELASLVMSGDAVVLQGTGEGGPHTSQRAANSEPSFSESSLSGPGLSGPRVADTACSRLSTKEGLTKEGSTKERPAAPAEPQVPCLSQISFGLSRRRALA